MRSSAWFVLLVCSLLLSGCGSKTQPKAVYATTGLVTYNRQPLAGVRVMFYPIDRATLPRETPTAITDAKGKYTLSTYGKSDGAPAGQYRVAIIPEKVKFDGQFPLMYVDPARSGLKAKVNTEATTVPDFTLQGPAVRY